MKQIAHAGTTLCRGKEKHFFNPRKDKCPRTHHTRLESRDENCIGQSFRLNFLRCGAKGEEFSVRRRIFFFQNPVPISADNSPAVFRWKKNQSTDRDFPGCGGFPGEGESFLENGFRKSRIR